jgi:hypothetical protein
VHVVSEAVQQRAGEAFRSEHLGPLIERKLVVTSIEPC